MMMAKQNVGRVSQARSAIEETVNIKPTVTFSHFNCGRISPIYHSSIALKFVVEREKLIRTATRENTYRKA